MYKIIAATICMVLCSSCVCYTKSMRKDIDDINKSLGYIRGRLDGCDSVKVSPKDYKFFKDSIWYGEKTFVK